MPLRVIVALAAAITIVFTAPFIGQVRGAVQAALPAGAFRLVVGAVVFGSVAAAVLVALVRIRERRALRYGLLAASLAIGVTYALASRTGMPSVDAVERFHFVEYGLLTWLFYRVWRQRADLSTIAGPVLATLVVGALDEWTQWFVPLRVGEIRDVALNGVAVICGLLFALGLDPPRRVALSLPRDVATRLLPAVTVATIVCFVDTIHLGHDVRLDDATFRSRFTASELEHASKDRARRWSEAGPPTAVRRLSREDQYLAEGLWHVQRRNDAVVEAQMLSAWMENRILERYFAPVLDHPSYASPAPSRWPPEQRSSVEGQVAAGQPGNEGTLYISRANPFPLLLWNRTMFRTLAAVATLACVLLFVRGSASRVAGARPQASA